MGGGVIVFRKCPDVALKHFVASNYGEGVLYHEDVLKPHLRCTSDTPLPCHHWSNVVWVCQSVGFFRAGAAYILSHIFALTHVDVAKRLQYGGFLVSLYSKFVHSHLKIHTLKKKKTKNSTKFPNQPKKNTHRNNFHDFLHGLFWGEEISYEFEPPRIPPPRHRTTPRWLAATPGDKEGHRDLGCTCIYIYTNI